MRLKAKEACWCGSGRKHKRCHGDRRALDRPHVGIGTVSAFREVPDAIVRPDYVVVGELSGDRAPQIHDASSLERLRHACQVAAEVLIRTGAAVAPGVTTDELDAIAHATYLELGAYPSTLHYQGFPKSVCTSVNGVVCHGIPDSRPLENGDIVNVDVTAFIDGMHGDTSATFCVGTVDEVLRGLVETTRRATLLGIAAVRPGEPLRRIAAAIEPFAASRGYGVIREYGGHGIGTVFHADPHIHHCLERDDDAIAVPWMSFTVEPMLTSGVARFHQADDGWTEHTDDDLPSAQFEHTVVVTDTGVEILTLSSSGATAVGTLADVGEAPKPPLPGSE